MGFIHINHINFSRPERVREFSLEAQVHPTSQQNTPSETSVKSSYRRVKAETALLKQAIDTQMLDAVVANEFAAKKHAQKFIAKYNRRYSPRAEGGEVNIYLKKGKKYGCY